MSDDEEQQPPISASELMRAIQGEKPFEPLLHAIGGERPLMYPNSIINEIIMFCHRRRDAIVADEDDREGQKKYDAVLRRGAQTICALHLRGGAPVNRIRHFCSPLYESVVSYPCLLFAQTLLEECKARFDERDPRGIIIERVTARKDAAMLRLLARHRAIDAMRDEEYRARKAQKSRQRFHQSALHDAVFENCPEVVRALVQDFRMPPHILNTLGQTPSDIIRTGVTTAIRDGKPAQEARADGETICRILTAAERMVAFALGSVQKRPPVSTLPDDVIKSLLRGMPPE